MTNNDTYFVQEIIGGWSQVAVFSGSYAECMAYIVGLNGSYYIVHESEYNVDYLND